jgi:hypothetical protein
MHVFSIYRYLGDIWFFGKLGQLFFIPKKHNLREIKYGEAQFGHSNSS